jgi:hypothetical protein
MGAGMPRAAALLALTASCGLVASCGGGRRAGTPAQARTGTTNQHAGHTLTRSQAVAFAHAVNLRAEDVPGFTASSKKEPGTADEARLERKLWRCVGATNAERGLAESGSPSFKRESGIVQVGTSSNVSVARTSAAATRELTELRSRRTRGCLQAYLHLLFMGPAFHGAPVDHVSLSLGIPPAFGTTGAFAWRIAVTFTVRSLRVPLYLDVLGFVYGPAQVTLFSSGFPVPFPAAGEEHLFSLLVARAKAVGA